MEKIGLFIGFLLYASVSTIVRDRRRRLREEHKIVNELNEKVKENLKDLGGKDEH